MDKIDLIICLGKAIFEDNTLDSILKSRIDEAVRVFLAHPESLLILTGGKGYSDKRESSISEASAMLNYVRDKYSQLVDIKRIVKEEDGRSTINQLCIIKEDIIIPNHYSNIALITDEVHMQRAYLILENILGNEYNILKFPSKLNIAGGWRSLIENHEKDLYLKTKETLVSSIRPGDHKAWLKADREIAKNLHNIK